MLEAQETLTQELAQSQERATSPYLGRTVLELIADQSDVINQQGPTPPPTPPVPFATHTTSGEGRVYITDDADQEYLYE